MKPSSSLAFVAATVLLAAHRTTAVALKAMTAKGCYSSSTGLTFNQTYIYQTSGYCQELCVVAGQSVLATSEQDACYCGNLLPPASSKVADSFCNEPCAGYDLENCGGDGYFTVYLSGLRVSVDNADASASTSASSAGSATPTTSVAPSVVTVGGGQVVTVTATSDASLASAAASAAAQKPSGPSKAGIAAGVVVGVLGVLGIVAGIFVFMRSRKRRAIEEEHRRNAAVSSFVGKPPTSSNGSFSDTRLDPAVMAQRRMSDGSIADNQDYSRRILKVTNA
ncbi:Cell wall integrity and stress response component 1 [Phlyctema vagabunda]|uniref:Cell wall integrity and stress response component 1 n=1 Tax=Phlyctema vagabunda TaxID=108571 RepID=A0ABR4PS96_9HELO